MSLPAVTRGLRRRSLLAALVLAVAALGLSVASASADDGGYTVQPGDTLAAIARRCDLTLSALARANAIQHPRELYPGQVLAVPDITRCHGALHPVAPGEDSVLLARATGAAPGILLRRNGMLLPGELLPGQVIWLPAGVSAHSVAVPVDDPAAVAPRVAIAVRQGASLWALLALNRAPLVAGQPVLVPDLVGGAAEGADDQVVEPGTLPAPFTALALSAQPVARGETVALMLETSQPVDCNVTFLDATEPCYSAGNDGRAWRGLVGLPPLMDTGRYTLTVAVSTPDGLEARVPLPLMVSAGRYDYERLDLPSDRQALLDPALSQFESDRIWALKQVRTPERYWDYPFQLPHEASVTSYYGSRRSYGYGFGSYHAGTDFQGEVGMPVLAAAAGTVVLAEPLVVRGNAIIIDHGWGVMTGYWHLSQIDVAAGQQVAAGDRIGLLGNTGLSTGPHLHWELWVDGVAVSALSWLDPNGAPALLGAGP